MNSEGGLSEEEIDDDVDEDDELSSDDDEGLEEELQGLQHDLVGRDAAEGVGNAKRIPTSRRRSENPIYGLGLSQFLDQDERPFTTAYNNPLLDKYSAPQHRQEMPQLTVSKRRQRRGQEHTVASKSRGFDPVSNTEHQIRRDSAGSSKSVHFENERPETPATVWRTEDSEEDDEDDEDFEPDEVDGSDKENAPPQDSSEEETEANIGKPAMEDSLASSDSDASESEETSSSGASSSNDTFSDSLSESEPEELSSIQVAASKADSTSSSSGSSSSDSESDSEGVSRSKKADVSPNTSIDDLQTTSQNPAQTQKPPRTGSLRTRKRNQRRRNANKLTELIAMGFLPAGATHKDLRLWRENLGQNIVVNDEAQASANARSPEIEERRKNLLLSLSSENIDLDDAGSNGKQPSVQVEDSSATLKGNNSPRSSNAPVKLPDQATADETVNKDRSPVVLVRDSLEQTEAVSDGYTHHTPPRPTLDNPAISEPTVEGEVSGHNLPHEGSAEDKKTSSGSGLARRTKLDLEGSKRLLFGSLGVRTPKTKQDRDRLQQTLSKDVKPQLQRKLEPDAPEVVSSHVDIDDESWRDKIDLRAVECCYDGIELSTPPFPFVQRWDPQQRKGYRQQTSKRKAKKRKRNNKSFYENQYDDSFNDDSQNKSPRRQGYAPVAAEARFQEAILETCFTDGQGGNDSAELHQNAQDANEQLIRETLYSENEPTKTIEPDDLPDLPADLSTCEPLVKDNCKKGVVVAFKKFEMNLGDQWHPYISDYRIAQVNAFHDGVVDMTYAKRDVPKRKKYYDAVTGERIYGNLEMPDYSDEDGVADESKLSIDLAELIEPIVIQAEEDYNNVDQNQKDSHNRPGQGQDESFETAPDIQHKTLSDEKARTLSRPSEEPEADHKSADNAQNHEQDIEPNAQRSQSSDLHDVTKKTECQASYPEARADIVEETQLQPNTQSRHDISRVFREAGWRSSIGSDVRRQLELQDQDETLLGDQGDKASKRAPSPAFNGFSSPPQSDNHQSSPYQPSSQSSHLESQIPDSAPKETDTSNSGLKTDTSIDYPFLPPIDDGSEYLPSQRQHRSISLEVPSDSTAQALSPPSLRRNQRKALGETPQPSQPFSMSIDKEEAMTFYDGTIDSDSDEFPALFSQRFEERLSQEANVKRESPQEISLSPASKRKTTKTTKSNTRNNIGSQRAAAISRTARNKPPLPSSQALSVDDDDSFWAFNKHVKPPRSQPTQESIVVDLTISSDPVDPIEHDTPYDADESYKPPSSMPEGSGWVKKGKGGASGKGKAEKARRRSQI